MQTRLRQLVLLLLASLLYAAPAYAGPAITVVWSPPGGSAGRGAITLTINGSYSRTIRYGELSNAASIASNFGGVLSLDPNSPVWAKGQTDGTILMKARNGSVTSLGFCYTPDGSSGCSAGSAPSGVGITDDPTAVIPSSGNSQPPQISALSVSHAQLGKQVVISGANLGTVATTTVTLANSPMEVVSVSSSSITVIIKNTDVSGNVVVNVGTSSSNSVAFTVDTPPLCIVGFPS